MECFVDYRTPENERKVLKNLGLNIIEVPKYSEVYDAINGHVDIQLNILDKETKKIIIHKNMDKNFKNKLQNLNINYIESNNGLSGAYPGNISLNALILKNYFVHNIKYSDKHLLEEQKHKTIINVKQGYTKCSCLPVASSALITSDIGIYNSLSKYDFDILLIPPGDIILEGLDYGFIGGTGGLISDNTLAFFGSLNNYKYGNEIKAFLKKHNVEPIYLSDNKLHDRGSLFVL